MNDKTLTNNILLMDQTWAGNSASNDFFAVWDKKEAIKHAFNVQICCFIQH